MYEEEADEPAAVSEAPSASNLSLGEGLRYQSRPEEAPLGWLRESQRSVAEAAGRGRLRFARPLNSYLDLDMTLLWHL